MIRNSEIHQRLKDIEDFLLEEYKERRGEKKRDWRTYEQRLTHRIKEAIRNLEPLIEEATAVIEVHRGRGKKPELTPKQKITLLLMKELFKRSYTKILVYVIIFCIIHDYDFREAAERAS